jgi:DNA-binding transcriptional ArsR family regulator
VIVVAAVSEDVLPEEVYALLADETRVAIVRALGEVGRPLAFSELRERVGVRDSGRFNYHLQRLVGVFLDCTEEGYVLTDDGERVADSLVR